MSIYAKLSVPSRGGNLNDVPVMEAEKADYRDAKTLSVFGQEQQARQFIQNNRELLAEYGWDQDAEVQTLANTKTGEVIGAYVRRRSRASAQDQANAMRAALS